MPLSEIVRRMEAPLTADELAGVSALAIAIQHAISAAERAPASLSVRARSMVIEKLQEAEHWMLELVRESTQ